MYNRVSLANGYCPISERALFIRFTNTIDKNTNPWETLRLYCLRWSFVTFSPKFHN